MRSSLRCWQRAERPVGRSGKDPWTAGGEERGGVGEEEERSELIKLDAHMLHSVKSFCFTCFSQASWFVCGCLRCDELGGHSNTRSDGL